MAAGVLSLAFCNRNTSILKRMLRGEFAEALREPSGQVRAHGWGNGAMALAEREVREWVHEAGSTVYAKAGIRISTITYPFARRAADRLGDLLTVERQQRREEPFASLGQHVYLLCARSALRDR